MQDLCNHFVDMFIWKQHSRNSILPSMIEQ